MIRRTLDRLYFAAGVLACIFLASIMLLVVLQVVSRFFGLMIAGLIEYATYAMVASTFLGLALALKRGTHVRVTLLLQAVPPGLRRVMELLCLAVASAILLYFSWFSLQLTLDSWRFNMLSMGLAATPLWIPQAGMALGGIIGAIAFVDELVKVLAGRQPSYQRLEGTTPPEAGMPAALEPAVGEPAPAVRRDWSS